MSNTPSPNASSQAISTLATRMYTATSPAAAVGAFRVADDPARGAIIRSMSMSVLPEEIVQLALERGGNETLWALSERTDLSSEVIGKLLKSGNTMVLRLLAGSELLSSEDLMKLLPGDDFIRFRIFMNPNASASLRKHVMSARSKSGVLLPSTPEMEGEIFKPEYARWIVRSGSNNARLRALGHVEKLPFAYQWDIARSISEGAVPLRRAVEVSGWMPQLRSLLGEALSVEALSSSGTALRVLGDGLESMGRPGLSAVEEAEFLADVGEVEALAGEDLPWGDLEVLLRSDRMSLPAVRFLLGRADRTNLFVSSAVVFHGDKSWVLGSCSLEDLQAAVSMTVFSPGEHSRLLGLFVGSPLLPYRLVDLLTGLPVDEVLGAIKGLGGDLRDYQLRRFFEELRVLFGDDAAGWEAFEFERQKDPRCSVGRAVAAGVAAVS